MKSAGIDTDVFKPYSTRSASASKLASTTKCLEKVLKQGNWRGTSSFFTYYLRKVKYFNRSSEKTENPDVTRECSVYTKNNIRHVTCARAPAAPVRRRARFALQTALSKLRKKPVRTPWTDLPPAQQGYDTASIAPSETSTQETVVEIDLDEPENPESNVDNDSTVDDTDNQNIVDIQNVYNIQNLEVDNSDSISIAATVSSYTDGVTINDENSDLASVISVNCLDRPDSPASTIAGEDHIVCAEPRQMCKLPLPVFPVVTEVQQQQPRRTFVAPPVRAVPQMIALPPPLLMHPSVRMVAPQRVRPPPPPRIPVIRTPTTPTTVQTRPVHSHRLLQETNPKTHPQLSLVRQLLCPMNRGLTITGLAGHATCEMFLPDLHHSGARPGTTRKFSAIKVAEGFTTTLMFIDLNTRKDYKISMVHLSMLYQDGKYIPYLHPEIPQEISAVLLPRIQGHSLLPINNKVQDLATVLGMTEYHIGFRSSLFFFHVESVLVTVKTIPLKEAAAKAALKLGCWIVDQKGEYRLCISNADHHYFSSLRFRTQSEIDNQNV